jgi:hypothetical protein
MTSSQLHLRKQGIGISSDTSCGVDWRAHYAADSLRTLAFIEPCDRPWLLPAVLRRVQWYDGQHGDRHGRSNGTCSRRAARARRDGPTGIARSHPAMGSTIAVHVGELRECGGGVRLDVEAGQGTPPRRD